MKQLTKVPGRHAELVGVSLAILPNYSVFVGKALNDLVGPLATNTADI